MVGKNIFLVFLLCVILSGCLEESSGSQHPMPANGALLLTQFKSLEELEKVIDIEYDRRFGKPVVTMTHEWRGTEVKSELKTGVDQSIFYDARTRGLLFRIGVVLKCPRALLYKNDLVRTELLARWRPAMFGEGDLAFYDIAQQMVFNIDDADIDMIPPEDLSEKGYLNTFNHVTAQAMITTIFSEDLADFISDLHERYAMPELITGVFSQKQLDDLETGPTDNYVDIINNEWGQELGKYLREKYKITKATTWTPELLCNYLNDIQNYYSWTFGIGFVPFRPTDRLIIHYSAKLNGVLGNFDKLTADYF